MALLGNNREIREDQYQGSDFSYPAIRIDISDQTPLGNGKICICLVSFSIIILDTQPSSVKASQISKLIVDEFFQSQIIGKDENNNDYFKLIRIDLINYGKILRTEDKLWEKEIVFQSEAHLL